MTKRRTDAPARSAPVETIERNSYKQHLDRRLDEALEETFPASDPIAVTPRRRRGAQSPANERAPRERSP